jgi:hypothetical protein
MRRIETTGGKDVVRYLVVNSGWAAIVLDHGRLAVSLRPAVVSSAAFAALLYMIGDSSEGPCGLSLYDGAQATWFEFPSRKGLMDALIAAVDTAIADKRLLRRSMPRIALTAQPALESLLGICEELDGHYDPERLWRCLTVAVRGRFAVVREVNDAIRLSALGRGFYELSHFWQGGPTTERLRDFPDVRYGRWVASTYQDVIVGNEPLIDMVDCMIDWPHIGRRRHQYWRVIVPMVTADGTRIALGATVADTSITLGKDSR